MPIPLKIVPIPHLYGFVMNIFQYLLIVSLLTFSASSFSARLADDIEPGDNINEIQLPLTKTSAAELIRLESKGKVLSVEEKRISDITLFRVKVLHKNGKIKIYSLDKATGHPPK